MEVDLKKLRHLSDLTKHRPPWGYHEMTIVVFPRLKEEYLERIKKQFADYVGLPQITFLMKRQN
jgi:hypothetical protein